MVYIEICHRFKGYVTFCIDRVAGNLDESDWQLEGRRLVPLMPRLVPQTAFSPAANNAAAQHLSKNLQMPLPPKTANKEGEIFQFNYISTSYFLRRQNLNS